MVETIKLTELIPAWKAVLEARKTTDEDTRKEYESNVRKFLSQELPYGKYLDWIKNHRASRTLGSDKTAIDQFCYFLVANRFIDKHPDPNYKMRRWNIKIEVHPWLP